MKRHRTMQKLRKALAVLFTLCLALSFAPAALADDGTGGSCGENVTWTLDADTGVLTISGTGDMEDYASDSDVPWYSQRDTVTTVIMTDGVTSIGYDAFYGCGSLTDVTIGDDVISIVDYAFAECGSLASLIIPDSVTSVGDMSSRDAAA